MSVRYFIEKLKSSGMKITPQRLFIIKKLLERGSEHPSLKTLYNDVHKELPTISFSTLYDLVKRLEELGIVKLFESFGETRIEVNISPHINIVDISKGIIKDYNDENTLFYISEKLSIEPDEIYLINVYIRNTKTRKNDRRIGRSRT